MVKLGSDPVTPLAENLIVTLSMISRAIAVKSEYQMVDEVSPVRQALEEYRRGYTLPNLVAVFFTLLIKLGYY